MTKESFPFSKYHGAGNDFILIDDRSLLFPVNRDLIAKLCDRRIGIGSDGLILLQNSSKADCRMRIFNADGSEAAMCGNGIRCLMHFFKSLGFEKKRACIETLHSTVFCEDLTEHLDDHFSFSIDPVRKMHWGIDLHLLKKSLKVSSPVYVLDTGVPHAVIFVPDVKVIEVEKLGREIRFSPLFSPEGVNVNFASIGVDNVIHIRTYERGVEGETLSCGTGVAATAYSAKEIFNLSSSIRVICASREQLIVDIASEKNLKVAGKVTPVFQGVLNEKSLSI